ncbi:secreted ShK toxin domain containing protein [Elysia marginata]|uniref:Secreted ShK toxin domain containing protein n=1 Tax=Elysia marginata TaxID=1093978 RepID=A0AAV4GR13_9GAST|nr:secreted ShK toxin domain containing protein [Elysia marginata]
MGPRALWLVSALGVMLLLLSHLQSTSARHADYWSKTSDGNSTFDDDDYNVLDLLSIYRPGSPTKTNSCQHVRGVPRKLRSSRYMKPDGIDNFYQKYTEAYGIPVLSSKNVSDDALRRACYVVRFLLAGNSQVRKWVYRMSGRLAVIGENEKTLDIPEHSHLDDHLNQRTRGLGAVATIPISTGAEENIMCNNK